MKDILIEKGEYAEGLSWRLIIPYEREASEYALKNQCPHAVIDGPTLRLPRGAVECFNQSGYDCTTLCLECLDAARDRR